MDAHGLKHIPSLSLDAIKVDGMGARPARGPPFNSAINMALPPPPHPPSMIPHQTSDKYANIFLPVTNYIHNNNNNRR